MADLVRISVSLDRELEDRLEEMRDRAGYTSRSELIRDLIRDRIVAEEWESAGEAVGTITLVYDHHAPGLHEKLTDLQHEQHEVVMVTTHIHLDRHLCAEAIVCRGPAQSIRRVADRLRGQRGVLHGALSMSSTGRRLLTHTHHEEEME